VATDRQTDRQTDTQTDTHTHTDVHDYNAFCVVYDSREMYPTHVTALLNKFK